MSLTETIVPENKELSLKVLSDICLGKPISAVQALVEKPSEIDTCDPSLTHGAFIASSLIDLDTAMLFYRVVMENSKNPELKTEMNDYLIYQYNLTREQQKQLLPVC